MDEVDAEGGVDEEGLRLRGGQTARGRITDVPDADGAFEGVDGLLVEDVGDEAVVLLFHEALPVEGDHAGGVLTAVLKHEKTLVQLGGGGAVLAKDADDAAHPSGLPARSRRSDRDQLGGRGVGAAVDWRKTSASGAAVADWDRGGGCFEPRRGDRYDGRATATDSICETYLEDARGRAETSAKERKRRAAAVIEEAA